MPPVGLSQTYLPLPPGWTTKLSIQHRPAWRWESRPSLVWCRLCLGRNCLLGLGRGASPGRSRRPLMVQIPVGFLSVPRELSLFLYPPPATTGFHLCPGSDNILYSCYPTLSLRPFVNTCSWVLITHPTLGSPIFFLHPDRGESQVLSCLHGSTCLCLRSRLLLVDLKPQCSDGLKKRHICRSLALCYCQGRAIHLPAFCTCCSASGNCLPQCI